MCVSVWLRLRQSEIEEKLRHFSILHNNTNNNLSKKLLLLKIEVFLRQLKFSYLRKYQNS